MLNIFTKIKSITNWLKKEQPLLDYEKNLKIPEKKIKKGTIISDQGGYTIIYQGTMVVGKTTTMVAIKELKKEETTKTRLKEYRRELQIWSILGTHPQIVSLYGISYTSTYKIIMEFCNQDTLYDWLQYHKNDRDSWDLKQLWALEIITGLQHLHRNNVLHMDLKSKNILLHNGHAKLSDFGNSKIITDPNNINCIIGALPWMSPGLFIGDKYSVASDIYSYGLILWEMTSHKVPFISNIYEEGLFSVFQRKQSGNLFDYDVPSFTPLYISNIITRCCNRNQDFRPSSETIINWLSSKNNSPKTVIRLPREVSIDCELIEDFFHCVAFGKQTQAEEALQQNNKLVFISGIIYDPAGRKFENITALQYAAWALDWHMWSMLIKYMRKEEIKKQLLGLNNGSWLKEHDVQISWKKLIYVLQSYVDYCLLEESENNNYQLMLGFSEHKKTRNKWVEIIGYEQSLLPAHVIQEYLRIDRSFYSCLTNKQTFYRRRSNTYGYLPRIKKSVLLSKNRSYDFSNPNNDYYPYLPKNNTFSYLSSNTNNSYSIFKRTEGIDINIHNHYFENVQNVECPDFKSHQFIRTNISKWANHKKYGTLGKTFWYLRANQPTPHRVFYNSSKEPNAAIVELSSNFVYSIIRQPYHYC